MNRYLLNIRWQIILLVTFSLGFISDRIVQTPIFNDILVGIVSSLILLLLFEFREFVNDQKKYGHFKGPYHRVDIYEVDPDAKSDTKYKSLTERYSKVTSETYLDYLGGRQYNFEIDYEEGRVKGVLFIDEQNLRIAKGNYQYMSKIGGKHLTDLGEYNVQLDELNYNRLFVFYKNIIPSGLAEGYEIWERKY